MYVAGLSPHLTTRSLKDSHAIANTSLPVRPNHQTSLR